LARAATAGPCKKEPWGGWGAAPTGLRPAAPIRSCVRQNRGGGDQGLGCGVLWSLSSAEPWPGMRYRVAPPRPGPYPPPYQSGGHCGGDHNVLRSRAVVTGANWRGGPQDHVPRLAVERGRTVHNFAVASFVFLRHLCLVCRTLLTPPGLPHSACCCWPSAQYISA
jgi:hypothetical protein